MSLSLMLIRLLVCRHELIKKLHVLKDSNPDLAKLLLEQVRIIRVA